MLIHENGSLKRKIYNKLKEDIIFCELLPNSVILESELCEKFSVSRTPVREALLELEKEGYVVVEPRKSTRVSKVSLSELRHINDARMLLEVNAIRSLSTPLTDEQLLTLTAFQNRYEQFDFCVDTHSKYKSYLQFDYDFHAMITSLCNNPYLIRFCEELLQRSARQWYLMFLTIESRVSKSIEEHIDVLNALYNGSAESAANLLEEHIRAFESLEYFE